MPLGEHWEWRGFGRTSSEFRAWFQTLPPYYPPDDALLRDEYLWTPHSAHNIKLRYDALKIKRFLDREGDFERWLEDPRDILPFPLNPERLRQIQALLEVQFPHIPGEPAPREAFLALVAQAQPPVHRVMVLKQRRLNRWRLPSGEEIVVEWTHIRRPQAVETAALEHEDLSVLTAAWKQLVPRLRGLRAMNYLQAIAGWMEV